MKRLREKIKSSLFLLLVLILSLPFFFLIVALLFVLSLIDGIDKDIIFWLIIFAVIFSSLLWSGTIWKIIKTME